MRKKIIKNIILIFILILSSYFTEAKKVSGFIITENSDTIFGTIKVSKFNLHTGGFILNGINLEPLHFEVFFRSNEAERFINFKATDIIGFGISYKSKDYEFKSFALESNTPIRNEKKRERFLQVCYNGKIALYKNLSRATNYNKPINIEYKILNYQSFTYYDYFLYNEKRGLTKIEILPDIKTMKDLLYLYDFEKEFVEKVPENTKLKNIKLILIQYAIWLENKELI